MRTMAAVALLSLAGGCNVVTSETPLFGPADEVGAPALRPGIWARAEPTCKFDPRTPVKTWPDCANAVIVRGGDLIDPRDPTTTNPYILAGGPQLILQVGDLVVGATYYYEGLKPLKQDFWGQITEASLWAIQCGPLERSAQTTPPSPDTLEQSTHSPLPGLQMKDGGDCLATHTDAVRTAAAASLDWRWSDPWPRNSDGSTAPFRWMRGNEW
jgi:hypothetical protein